MFMNKRRFLLYRDSEACVLGESVSIIRFIILRCHEHFKGSTEG
jgi:hypothetical protein